ncbi:MAG: AMP-binding protein [Myxococcales bacterium]|nr:AMP-binding protein [Myxococcales bacterium]
MPLSHIAEQVVSIHGPMAAGGCTYFAESMEKLGDNLREVRPHSFVGVPRVWEKIQAKMVDAGAKNPRLKKKIAVWARKQGLAGGYADQGGRAGPCCTTWPTPSSSRRCGPRSASIGVDSPSRRRRPFRGAPSSSSSASASR